MTEEHRLISAESVTEGHPDKVCDQISDAILDDLLAQDSSSHVAVETSAATGVFLVFGEVTSEGYCDVQSKVRETLRNIGYTSSEVGLDADSKYALAIFAAKRARQINSYFTQLNEGLLQNIGPLVEYQNNEKPLSIAFREIDEGLLEETLGEDDANEGN